MNVIQTSFKMSVVFTVTYRCWEVALKYRLLTGLRLIVVRHTVALLIHNPCI